MNRAKPRLTTCLLVAIIGEAEISYESAATSICTSAVLADVGESHARLDASRARLDSQRLRIWRGWRTADKTLLCWYDRVDWRSFHAAVSAAIDQAVLGTRSLVRPPARGAGSHSRRRGELRIRQDHSRRHASLNAERRGNIVTPTSDTAVTTPDADAHPPRSFCHFLSVLVGITTLCGGGALIVSNTIVGRPSSTTGLDIVMLVILTCIFSVGGWMAGMVITRLIAADIAVRLMASTRMRLCLLLLAPTAAAAWGYVIVKSHEEKARPRVLISTEWVYSAPVVAEFADMNEAASIAWPRERAVSKNERMPDVTVLDQVVSISLDERNRMLDVSYLDYVSSVYLIGLASTDGVSGYALVATGRATGRRAVIGVLSVTLDVLYLEIVERWWPIRMVPLYSGSDKLGRPGAQVVDQDGRGIFIGIWD